MLSKSNESDELPSALVVAEKRGLKLHPYYNFIEPFKQKSDDRFLDSLNPIG